MTAAVNVLAVPSANKARNRSRDRESHDIGRHQVIDRPHLFAASVGGFRESKNPVRAGVSSARQAALMLMPQTNMIKNGIPIAMSINVELAGSLATIRSIRCDPARRFGAIASPHADKPRTTP